MDDFDLREVIDKPGRPNVIAMTINESPAYTDAHYHHASGQLYCLSTGIMMVKSMSGLIANPPRFVGWIPPETEHCVATAGLIDGWAVFIAPEVVKDLPKQPTILRCSSLVKPLVDRLCEWPQSDWSTEAYNRMGAVLLDELRLAAPQQPSLPLPDDMRLRAIANSLIADPADPRSGPELARSAGMSLRSFSRHWTQSVGMSISRFRQVARVFKSLDGLAKGQSVQHVAWVVGFESVSAFIAAFRKVFGETPGKYVFRQERRRRK